MKHKKRAFRASPQSLDPVLPPDVVAPYYSLPPDGVYECETPLHFERAIPSTPTGRLQTVRCDYVPYPGTSRTSRETKTKQFWQISCDAFGIAAFESVRPEFDIGLKLEALGLDPSTKIEFYRHGKLVLKRYDLNECVRGYWADTFRGQRYITRKAHEQNKERKKRFIERSKVNSGISPPKKT